MKMSIAKSKKQELTVEQIVEEVKGLFKYYLPEKEWQLFLYGSQVRGDAVYNSDIDMAIFGKKKVSWEKMVRLKAAIEGIPTLRKVDVVDLNNVSKDFKKEVLSYAKKLN